MSHLNYPCIVGKLYWIILHIMFSSWSDQGLVVQCNLLTMVGWLSGALKFCSPEVDPLLALQYLIIIMKITKLQDLIKFGTFQN